ncbi:MAG: protease modulator HflK, partial [Oscillospiraceae bacterium]|nr:protease modulator HflK [Oscillospiraceae bacterium]
PPDVPADAAGGLIDLRRDRPAANRQAEPMRAKEKMIVALCLAVFGFRVLADIGKTPDILSWARYGEEALSIFNAALLLVFAAVFFLYLKLRPGKPARPGDKTSHDLLALLGGAALLYGALTAAGFALHINVLPVLCYAHCAFMAYLIGAAAANLAIALFRRNILDNFDYSFLPKHLFAKGKVKKILETEEVKARFSLKSLWTFRYAVKILPGLALLLGAVLFLSTAVYVVQPQQQAAVYRFGRFGKHSVAGEGLHVKFPWPIDKIEIYDVDRVNEMQIGYRASEARNFLWTQEHDGGEYTLLLGNGNEAVSVNIKLLYKITDLYAYLKTCARPEEVLSAAAYEAIMRQTVNTTLDAFLRVDRSSLSGFLETQLSAFCEARGLGLSVVQVIVEGIHPPVEIAGVYQRVVTASVDKSTLIVNADSEAGRLLIEADRQSKEAIAAARADQHSRVSGAREEMAVYYSAVEAYKLNPACFRLYKYIETYEKVIGGQKVYVFSPGTEKDISRFYIGKNPALFTQNADQ